MMKLISTLFALVCLLPAWAQKTERAITFPDIPGFQTLKCDFHIHTVFSDGSVWPSIRIEEALKDGLDAIALTEHLEYQPHLEDIPHLDRNRSYEIAKQEAKAFDLIVVHGTEITRDMPPGHANALFIEDANKINVPDALEAYREARRQGAFIFWNHPNWIAQQHTGVATLSDLHHRLIDEDLLHGIEVVNDLTYSTEALQIAQDEELTVMGTSDIHGLVDWQYEIDNGGHRPISLVFATEKSEEAIKDAMFAGRTVAWFNNLLIGSKTVLEPLITHSIEVLRASYEGPSSVLTIRLKNSSDASFQLLNRSPFTLHRHADIVELPAQSTIDLQVKTGQQMERVQLEFEVLNAIEAPKTHPVVSIDVEVDL